MRRTMMTALLLLAGMLPAPAQVSDGKAETVELFKQAEKARTSGKSKEAAQLYEKAVARARVVFGPDHAVTASFMNNLAMLYEDMGQYAKAEPLYKRCLEIKVANLGKDHPDVASAQNGLAILYASMGQFAKAESLFKSILATREATLGKDHPDVAESLNNLANVYESRLDRGVII